MHGLCLPARQNENWQPRGLIMIETVAAGLWLAAIWGGRLHAQRVRRQTNA